RELLRRGPHRVQDVWLAGSPAADQDAAGRTRPGDPPTLGEHMTKTLMPAAKRGGTLKRSLGLWAIVGLGLGYMTPTVVFDTFGLVSRDTNNVVPLAYAVALIVMVFTAISYGKIAGAIPSAGSAYTYAR